MDDASNTGKEKHLAEMMVDSLCGLATEEETVLVRDYLIAEQKKLDNLTTTIGRYKVTIKLSTDSDLSDDPELISELLRLLLGQQESKKKKAE